MSVWNGGSGNWAVNDNWTPEGYPNNSAGVQYVAAIDNHNPVNSEVLLDRNVTVSGLLIDEGDRLTVRSAIATRFTVDGGVFDNAGTVHLDGTTGASTALEVKGPLGTGGGGTIELTRANILGDGSNRLQVNNQTIRGWGLIGGSLGPLALRVLGDGAIEANQPGEKLVIQPNAFIPDGDHAVVNMGRLLATGGGRLDLDAGEYDNRSGHIEAAGAGSAVYFKHGSVVWGGVLEASGGGRLLSGQRGTSAPILHDNVEIRGGLTVQDGYDFTLRGAIRNLGTISMEDSANGGNLQIYDDVFLHGGGSVRMAARAYDGIYGYLGSGRLVNVDNTIHGAGRIGDEMTGQLVMDNHGSIIADIPGATLILDPEGGSADTAKGLTNIGTLGAHGGGILHLYPGSYRQEASGVIEARGYDSVVKLGRDVAITGGTLGAGVLGTIVSDRKGTDCPRLADLTIGGWVRVPADTQLALSGTINVVELGLLGLDGSNPFADLFIEGETTLRKPGDAVMVSMPHDHSRILGRGPDAHLVAEGIIEGGGRIGDDTQGPLQITLRSSIRSIGPLVIDPRDGPAGFRGEGGKVMGVGGPIRLADGEYLSDSATTFEGLIELGQGAVLKGGQLVADLAPSGKWSISSIRDGTNAPWLQDLSIDGGVSAADGMDLGIGGRITSWNSEFNNIQITSSTGDPSELRVLATATLAGIGVEMDHPTASRIVGSGPASRLTLESDAMISGSGQVGCNSLAITNNGVITNYHPMSDLAIDPVANPADGEAGMVNRGQIVTFGSWIYLHDGEYDNAAGAIRALESYGNPGVVGLRAGAHIRGGILEAENGSRIHSAYTGESNPPSLGDVTLKGCLELPFGTGLTLQNELRLDDGFVALDSIAILWIRGTVSLTGEGRVTLSDSTRNWIVSRDEFGPNGIVNHVEISGAGRIGGDWPLTIANHGFIRATGANALRIYPSGRTEDTPSLFNERHGRLGAVGTGGMIVEGGSFSNLGTVYVMPGSSMRFSEIDMLNFDAATGRLAGGMWQIRGTSGQSAVLTFPSEIHVQRNQALVILEGQGASFPAIESLTHNEAGGRFAIELGKVFTTLGTFYNEGRVEVLTQSVFETSGSYIQTGGHTRVDGQLRTIGGTVDIQGGTLGGTGTVNGGPVNFTATLSPGASAGTLTIEQLNYLSGSTYEFEIDGAVADNVFISGAGESFSLEAGGTYHVNVSVLSGGVTLDEYPLFTWAGDDPFNDRDGFESVFWDFGRFSGAGLQVAYRPEDNTIVLTNLAGIPEPDSLGLLALGLAAMLCRRRRRTSP